MLRDALFGQWSRVDRSSGTYIQVRPDDVLVFEAKSIEPKARIDYNEAAGVHVVEEVLKILNLCKYQSGELHLRVDEKKNKKMYITRTPQGAILVSATEPF